MEQQDLNNPQQANQQQVYITNQIIAVRPTNVLCIISLILAVISALTSWLMFPIVGAILALIFGIIGVRATTAKQQSGKGLGIAGIIISSIGIGIGLITLLIVGMCSTAVVAPVIGAAAYAQEQQAIKHCVVNDKSEDYGKGFKAGTKKRQQDLTNGKIKEESVMYSAAYTESKGEPQQKKDFIEGYLDGYFTEE